MVRYQYCCLDIDDAIKDMEIDKFLLLNDGPRPGKKSRDEEVPDKQRKERIEIAKRDIDGFGLVLCVKRKRNEDYPDYSQRLICCLGKTEKNIHKVFYILRRGPYVLQFWTLE